MTHLQYIKSLKCPIQNVLRFLSKQERDVLLCGKMETTTTTYFADSRNLPHCCCCKSPPPIYVGLVRNTEHSEMSEPWNAEGFPCVRKLSCLSGQKKRLQKKQATSHIGPWLVEDEIFPKGIERLIWKLIRREVHK